MSLDGLTDLISNAVGLGILFLMIALLRTQDHTPTLRLEVEPEYAPSRAPAFFLIKGSRLTVLDTSKIFAHARQHLAYSEVIPQRFGINHHGVEAELDDQGIVLQIVDTRPWSVLVEPQTANNPLGIALDQLDRQRQFAFVFVWSETQGNGFQTFRQLRDQLLNRGIPVGWRPVSAAHPPVLCFDESNQPCLYRPATPNSPKESTP